jgi:ubiquinone/menaquinone biosynthesis C-methylase UbiE/predicted  nucleic acid-binding Zn-ribbon protein
MEKSMLAEDLAWTGERLVTTCHRPLVYEHLHRYAVAFGLAKRKRVLDIACGEGYGANLLARIASKVTGVDLDAGTIAHAKAKYRHRNLHFVRGSCTEIPCEDHSIDLVASFETIEHISEHGDFLSEIKRVLVPGGILVISSPHKAEYQKVSETANPFHEAELDHDEFVQLITKTFKHCVAAKQRLVVGSWIAPDGPSAQVSTATFRGWFDGIDIESGVYRGIYSIAICSDRALPVFNLGMFENFRDSADAWNLLDTYDTPAQLSAQLLELSRASDEKTKQVLRIQHEFEEKAKHVVLLQGELKEKSQQVAHFQREIEEKAKHVVLLQGELKEKSQQVAHFQREVEEKSKHVTQLQRECDQHSQLLERLKNQLEVSGDWLTRTRDELLDARWEALTLRGTLLRRTDSAETLSSRILELENRVETATSERDHLRKMLTSLQHDLEQERITGASKQDELRAQLKATIKDLRSAQKQMDRLRENLSRKLILPFGRSQRKLQQLAASRRADD